MSHGDKQQRHKDQLAKWAGMHGFLPESGEVVDAFAVAMGDNQYGVEETWDAFCWFRNGFNSAGARPPSARSTPTDEDFYFGKDCPKGMVQVEFVGVDPKLRHSDYGWKPSPSAFLEVWVDGKRFRIDVGDMSQYGHEGKRGLHVNYRLPAEVENRSCNALTITLPEEK